MEHFVAGFVATLLTLVVSTGALFFINSRRNVRSLSDNAVYTTEIGFSKSKTVGTLKGVFCDTGHTRALVILSFPESNAISLDASDYTVTVYAADDAASKPVGEVASAMNGGLYVFGSTGDMGLYLTCPGGFESEIIYVVLRNNNDFSANLSAEDAQKEDEFEANILESFEDYDQCGFFLNPAGNKAEHIAALDVAGEPSVADLYYEAVASHVETELRDVLQSDLETLDADMRQIESYEKRLVERHGVGIPDKPVTIAGDVMTYYAEDDRYRFEPMAVVAGGCDFDWFDTNLAEGYGRRLNLGSQSLSEYLVELRGQDSHDDFSLNGVTWNYLDGSPVNMSLSDDDTSLEASVMKDCKSLQDLWSQYYKHKATYEREDLPRLLALEVQRDSIPVQTTSNMSADFLTRYSR